MIPVILDLFLDSKKKKIYYGKKFNYIMIFFFVSLKTFTFFLNLRFKNSSFFL